MSLNTTTLNTTTSTATAYVRPQSGESAPYYDRYISLVPGADVLAALDEQRRQTLLLLCGRPETDGDLRYAPDKWSLREVLGHLNDTERIMSYRALRISRGDKTPIEGYEQDDYVRNSPLGRRPLADLIEDYIAVRRATISLFRNLDEEAWTRRGTANKNEVTVRALAYIIAGHELHHRQIIEEKYLK
jgi:DinB superfamily